MKPEKLESRTESRFAQWPEGPRNQSNLGGESDIEAGPVALSECSAISGRKETPKRPRKVSADRRANELSSHETFGNVVATPSTFVRMRLEAFEKLRRTVGIFPVERGGIFVGKDAFLVEDFVFDDTSDPASTVYYPNVSYLNSILNKCFEPRGLFFVGVGHSHPRGLLRPSGNDHWGDVRAARNNLLSKGNTYLNAIFIPIIESEAETGRFHIHPFVMLREDLVVHPARLEIVE